MLGVNGEVYELSFGVKRLEMAEAAIKKSVIQAFDGTPTIRELCTVAAYGMKASSGGWVAPAQGIEAAERAVEDSGFMTLYTEVTDALQRDCGFLFR